MIAPHDGWVDWIDRRAELLWLIGSLIVGAAGCCWTLGRGAF